ncbi:MAG: hypothetical protein J6112_04460 [Clostridia bacterium]|nr:hypothetical protein [Clostridia bacterium]
MDNYIEDLNKIAERAGMDSLIKTGEAAINLQYENLLRTLDAKTKNIDTFFGVIFVAGPSASGKTTFSNRLADKIRSTGISVNVISLDNFYHNRAFSLARQKKLGIIPQDATEADYERIDAFDISKFKKVVKSFIAWQPTRLPTFDFNEGKHFDNGPIIKREGRDVLIVEGIQGMNPKVFGGFKADFKFKIYICPFNTYTSSKSPKLRITPQMIRFMRRANRDLVTRNSSLLRTCLLWPSVRRGEEEYIKPAKKYADVFINTSYSYEPFYLCGRMAELLKDLPPEDVETVSANLNIEASELFYRFREYDIPKDSVFNEFFY